jgi:hypothetical protein
MSRMTATYVDRAMSLTMTLFLAALLSSGLDTGLGGAADSAPLSEKELRSLVAPIALYPDPLVAQMLAAATFPDQVAVASYWLQQHRSLNGQVLMDAANSQPWNASVKGLVGFPSVLDNMSNNLNWTSALGEAYHNQPGEVMAAIQTLRAQAKGAGNLKSGSQLTVTQESPQVITIQPANPEVVYVPQYDPGVIYGMPYYTPNYINADTVAGSMLGFGTGIAVGAYAGGCCGWGWGTWNTNWSSGAVAFNHNNFYGNSAWHGGYYNGGYHDGYVDRNAYNRASINSRGSASRVVDWNRSTARDFAGEHGLSTNSWAHADDGFRSSNALSGFGDHFGGGWASRANSFRGWRSMRSSGFSGGRFAGGRFGGGGFRGRR